MFQRYKEMSNYIIYLKRNKKEILFINNINSGINIQDQI